MKQIRYKPGYKYILWDWLEDGERQTTPYTCQTIVMPGEHVENDWISLTYDGILTIQPGYASDGPSGPTVDTKTFMRGALHHDALYQLMREGLLPKSFRKQADKELRRVCREDGMSAIRAWYVYNSVRAFGGKSATASRPILTAP